MDEGVSSFTFVVCSLKILWTFSMNNFILFLFFPHIVSQYNVYYLSNTHVLYSCQRFNSKRCYHPHGEGMCLVKWTLPSHTSTAIQVTLAFDDKYEDLPLLAEENMSLNKLLLFKHWETNELKYCTQVWTHHCKYCMKYSIWHMTACVSYSVIFKDRLKRCIWHVRSYEL